LDHEPNLIPLVAPLVHSTARQLMVQNCRQSPVEAVLRLFYIRTFPVPLFYLSTMTVDVNDSNSNGYLDTYPANIYLTYFTEFTGCRPRRPRLTEATEADRGVGTEYPKVMCAATPAMTV